MQINDINKARENIKLLENIYFSEKKTQECTERLLTLLQQIPRLTKDKQCLDSLKHLTEGIYSTKDTLPEEKQAKISCLFFKFHHLKPTRIENLLTNSQPVNSLVHNTNYEAILCGKQKYPIPASFIQDKLISCKEYFKPISVELGGGNQVEISHGLLSHLLEKTHLNALPEKIELKWMNAHQLDCLIAFLETSQPDLIHENNALSCMYTGAYLQIPSVIEACKPYVYPSMDEKTMVFLLNHLDKNKNLSIINYIEKQISYILIQALTQKPCPTKLMDTIDYLQKNLQNPVTATLSGTDISNNDLELLKDFPLKSLVLLNCNHLTPTAFSVLEKFPTLNTLKLGGNLWVNNDALSKIPSKIQAISLAGCSGFTGEGLQNLQTSNVKSLDIMGCNQLSDNDLACLPDKFESLDFRLCTGIGEKTMHRLGQIPNLQKLVLANTSITNDQIAFLPATLTSLDLSGCNLNDKALHAISNMDKLKELFLSDTNITDTGLTLLPLLIETLKLDRCTEITEEGLKSLATHKKLKWLSVNDCPNMTYNVLKLFKHNNIKVMWLYKIQSHSFK